ncbi:hypothetical protein PILCRDRAFT_824247 [Piloderma croceum F 1598]|uniref:Uncharacterized protein n=1 Tax=Piloderma croceum (strain F 1598) TaxID=765440 RepID=A0A0C3AX85_PILCF|nr:hypothetical protein PILCRDRAFT_824247 [Piloderma croceum F 1598]
MFANPDIRCGVMTFEIRQQRDITHGRRAILGNIEVEIGIRNGLDQKERKWV